MNENFKPRIVLFHCINIFGNDTLLPIFPRDLFELKTVKLPCSSMVKDVFLLRAFETGADAVIVMVCPEGACRYIEGNIRAQKRVGWIKKLLDEIGLDAERLSLFNIAYGDEAAVAKVIQRTLKDLTDLGPNPAA